MTTREPAECLGTCCRMVRPYKTTVTRWPGTSSWYAAGMCKMCHTKRTDAPPKPVFRTCEQCAAVTRPKGMPAMDAPEGSRQRVGELCVTCYAASTTASPETIDQIRAGVIAYFKWRGREIPSELLKEAS